MRIILKIDGVTGLVQHNERLADEDDDYTRQIKAITSKRSNKTDADREEIARLEWYGGLYHDREIGVYVPSWNLIRCFERAAAMTRNGANVIRALSAVTDKLPLQYEGPRELAKLYALPEFRLRKMVGVGKNRVMRVRPIFRRWGLEFEAEFLEDVLNIEVLERIVEQAGRSEGLGDARKLGYGRFLVELIR